MLIELRTSGEKEVKRKYIYVTCFEPFYCPNMADSYIHIVNAEKDIHDDITLTSEGDFRYKGQVYDFCAVVSDEDEASEALSGLTKELEAIRDEKADEGGIAFAGRIDENTWKRACNRGGE